MAKKSKKTSRKKQVPTDRKRIFALLGIVLFAAVGGYLVFHSKAATSSGDFFFDEQERTAYHPSGSNFTANLYAKVPANSYADPAGKMSVVVVVESNPSDKNPAKRVEFQGYTCQQLGNCVNVSIGGAVSSNEPMYDYNIGTCVDVDPSKFSQASVKTFAINYKSTYSGSYFVKVSATWYKGTCNGHSANSNFDSFYSVFQNATGGDGAGGSGTGGDAPGPSNGNSGSGGSGSGGSGSGTGGDTTGGGAKPPTTPSNTKPATPGTTEVSKTEATTNTEPTSPEPKADEIIGTSEKSNKSKTILYVAAGIWVASGIGAAGILLWRKRIY